MQPAFGVDGLGGFFGLVEIAHEQIVAPDQDFALRRNANFAPGCGLADRAELDAIGRHHGGDAAIFGLAIDFAHVDAERQIPADQFRRDWRSPGEGQPAAIQPQHAPDVAEHQPVGGAVDQAQRQRRRLAFEPAGGHAIADAKCVAVHPVLEWRGILQRDGDARIEFFPDPRHRQERGRLHFAQIVRHGFRALGEIHHRSQRQRDVIAADPLGDMAQRQEHQPLFGIGGGKQIVGVAHLMGDAAVGMHRALGRACGARGINQDSEIIDAAAADHLPPQRLAAHHVIAAQRHELGK